MVLLDKQFLNKWIFGQTVFWTNGILDKWFWTNGIWKNVFWTNVIWTNSAAPLNVLILVKTYHISDVGFHYHP